MGAAQDKRRTDFLTANLGDSSEPVAVFEEKIYRLCVEENCSPGRAARELGTSATRVRNILFKNGWACKKPQPAGLAAATVWRRSARIKLLDRLFVKAERMAEEADTAQDFAILVKAISILIDKRRLEEGKATDRVEMVGLEDDFENRLATIVERRRTGGAIIDVHPETTDSTELRLEALGATQPAPPGRQLADVAGESGPRVREDEDGGGVHKGRDRSWKI